MAAAYPNEVVTGKSGCSARTREISSSRSCQSWVSASQAGRPRFLKVQYRSQAKLKYRSWSAIRSPSCCSKSTILSVFMPSLPFPVVFRIRVNSARDSLIRSSASSRDSKVPVSASLRFGGGALSFSTEGSPPHRERQNQQRKEYADGELTSKRRPLHPPYTIGERQATPLDERYDARKSSNVVALIVCGSKLIV